LGQKIFTGEDISFLINSLKEKKYKKIFIVTGKKSFSSSGAREYLLPVIEEFEASFFSNFEENPKLEDVYKGIDLFNKENFDCCIAIGGGSVIDMAKLICYLNNDVINSEQIIKKEVVTSNTIKTTLIAIPTTCGAGSESTHFAVVYVNGEKFSLADETILPDLVFLNPKISYTMPKYLKAVTGIDAFSQAIESYWSRNSTEESRKYSLKALDLIWNNLWKSVNENNYDSHVKIVKGANLAGQAINIAKTTAPHAISYYFTSKHNINHGHAVALTLGSVYEFNYKLSKKKNIKENLFSNLNNILKVEEKPKLVLNEFLKSLGLELSYDKLGVNIEEEIGKVLKSINIERLKNNPFKLNHKDLGRLIINN